MTPEITSLYVHNYVQRGLAAMPDVLESLLFGLPPESLDARPDPDRFTLREVMAHLADWETVWQPRLHAMLTEENPAFPLTNIGERASEKNYAAGDLGHSLTVFRARRADLVRLISGIPDADLLRTGNYASLQTVTVAEITGFILGHDGYHLQQITDFRRMLV